MNSQTDIWITLRVSADELAQKQFGESWEGQRNALLSRVFAATWLGQFKNAAGQAHLKLNDTHQSGRKPEPITREELLRRFPMGETWVPKEVRDHAPPANRYRAMSGLLWDDYPESVRRYIMENILIPRDAFEAWAKPLRRRRGRKPGDGSYDPLDEPYLARMHELLTARETTSAVQAALRTIGEKGRILAFSGIGPNSLWGYSGARVSSVLTGLSARAPSADRAIAISPPIGTVLRLINAQGDIRHDRLCVSHATNWIR